MLDQKCFRARNRAHLHPREFPGYVLPLRSSAWHASRCSLTRRRDDLTGGIAAITSRTSEKRTSERRPQRTVGRVSLSISGAGHNGTNSACCCLLPRRPLPEKMAARPLVVRLQFTPSQWRAKTPKGIGNAAPVTRTTRLGPLLARGSNSDLGVCDRPMPIISPIDTGR